jgi:hypothetical protein
VPTSHRFTATLIHHLLPLLVAGLAAADRCCAPAVLPAADAGLCIAAAGFWGVGACCCTAPMVDTVLRFPVLDGSGFLYSRCSDDTSTTAFSLRGVGSSCAAPAGRSRGNFWSDVLKCIAASESPHASCVRRSVQVIRCPCSWLYCSMSHAVIQVVQHR